MSIIINFMLSEFVKRAKILLQIKSNTCTVIDINKKFLEYNKEKIDYKTEDIRL